MTIRHVLKASVRSRGDLNVRMTLTGQVFVLMTGVATDAQAVELIRSVEHYLYDESVGGPRLNTDFGEVLHNLGRCFGFAYGHKENGAMFTHMAVMYANALYRRGFAREGYRVSWYLPALSELCCKPDVPRFTGILPQMGAVFTYLTGSAAGICSPCSRSPLVFRGGRAIAVAPAWCVSSLMSRVSRRPYPLPEDSWISFTNPFDVEIT